MRILVTGGNGFVARALLPALALRGHAVRPAARRPMPHAASVVVGDLGARTDWSAALEGCDAVIHLAARVHVMHDTVSDALSAYREVNVEGTRKLALDAAAAGVRRFVFLSTAKVLGEWSPHYGPFADDDPPAPADPYAVSKHEAEVALAEVGARTELETVVLRPPLVYGPGVGANFLRLIALVASGRMLPFGAVANRRSLVYAGNLASAIAVALEHAGAVGRTALVSDGEDVSTAELVRRLGGALGRPARLVAVPPVILRLAGMLTGRRAELDRLLGDFALAPTALAELGWRPPFTMSQGLAETAAWYRAREAAEGAR
jgi:nucleoside-diphosphate-sugar epimerase